MLNGRATITWCCALALALCLWRPALARGADWPTYGNGAQRQHVTEHQLPAKVSVEWEAKFPAPNPVWPTEGRLHIDQVYEPVLSGGVVYLGLNSTDRLVALGLETGREVWSFAAEGPIRRPPAVYDGAVYFTSDDGHCYCLDAGTGELRWKYFAGPARKYVLGNGRVISQWAARCDVLVSDGKVYFASGVWPFMGTFVQALDAKTGKELWKNSDSSNFQSLHPHGKIGMGGLSPQGTIALCDNILLVSNGRARPIRFDAATGERLPYETGWQRSGWQLTGAGDKYFNGAYLLDLQSCTLGYFLCDGTLDGWSYHPVIDGDAAWVPGQNVRRYDLSSKPMPVLPLDHKLRRDYPYNQFKVHGSLEYEVLSDSPECDHVWMKGGDQLFTSKGGKLMALDCADGRELWSHVFAADVGSVISGQGKLLVSTRDGSLYCFGSTGGRRTTVWHVRPVHGSASPAAMARMEKILGTGVENSGCCLVAGIKDGELVKALALEGGFYRVIAFDTRAARVAKLRAELTAMGLYGARADVICGDIDGLPPYLMNVICSEDALSTQDPGVVFDKLRPYGGRACFEAAIEPSELAGLAVSKSKIDEYGDMVVLSRSGPLAGSAPWTHDNGTPGNTMSSEDAVARGPLGVTWYGGKAGGDHFIDRHKGAPRPQVVNGRVFCQKRDLLTCYDAYTGQLLWQKEIPGMAGFLAERDHPYSPRAFIVMGGNMVSLADTVYVKTPGCCYLLDPATGDIRSELTLPAGITWGTISILDDVLVVQAGTRANRETGTERSLMREGVGYRFGFGTDPWNGGVHTKLFALDRHTGSVLWSRDATFAYRSNALALGNGKMFLIDFAPEGVAQRFRGIRPSDGHAQLLALGLRNGRELWRHDEGIIGSWLGYSRQADVVVEVPDATVMDYDDTAIRGWEGSTGKQLWQGKTVHMAGVVIVGDMYFDRGLRAYDLRTNSLLGSGSARGRGCDNELGSVNMLTFRTSTSGYFDLTDHGGLVAMGGFRPSCNGSLIPADGLLNAPKVAYGCICNYSIKTSLALAHMPYLDTWGATRERARADRIGINLGAPGDRVSEQGTTFFQFPVTAWRHIIASPVQDPALEERDGKRRDLVVSTIPEEPSLFQKPSLSLSGQEMAWVGASGMTGLRELRMEFGQLHLGRGTVRLYFADFEATRPGQRVFDVAINGRPALKGLDVVEEAGGPGHVLMKEVEGVEMKDTLTISLSPSSTGHLKETILSGIELIKQ
jgi:outer membrane protein assembly factor BamB